MASEVCCKLKTCRYMSFQMNKKLMYINSFLILVDWCKTFTKKRNIQAYFPSNLEKEKLSVTKFLHDEKSVQI